MKGEGVALQVAEPRYSMSVMIENNGVSERKQCFSCKCHVFNIYFYKSSFRNPCLHHQLNRKPHYALDIADVMLGSISFYFFIKAYL